jgi:hypothetical protein
MPEFDFKEKEEVMWNTLPALSCEAKTKRETKKTTDNVLKLVVNGHAFCSICSGKRLEFRKGNRILSMLTKNEYTHVQIFHGYYDKEKRPYIIKEFKGAVVAENGVKVSYPLMDVCTTELTYCIRMGETVDYFNPQPMESQKKYLNKRLKMCL